MTFQELPAVKVVTYNAALSACSQCGQSEAALRLFEQMFEDTSLPVPNEVSFNAVITACAVGLRWSEGLALLRRGRFNGALSPYNALASSCCRSHALTSALELLEEVGRLQLQRDTLSYLALTPALGVPSGPRARELLCTQAHDAEAVMQSASRSSLTNELGPSLALA
ncbi:unnamed protein product, partial [Symbiodinium pilosum]